MHDYDHFDVEELSQDNYFRDWVLGRAGADDTFWENWQSGNTLREEKVNEARLLVLALDFPDEPVFTAEEINAGKRDILAEISREPELRSPVRLVWIRIAASIIVVLGLGWWLADNRNQRKLLPEASISVAQTVKRNDSPNPVTIKLPDGSSVVLDPQSELRYGHIFGKSRREVYLTGGGFFDVVKDASKPFLVHTKTIVTRVVGTSFYVAAYEKGRDIEVSVKTGRVTVSRQSSGRIEQNVPSQEIVLSPNQKVVFNKEQQSLVKTLVNDPMPLSKRLTEQDFNFDGTSIEKAFQLLEDYYGVQISYDPQLMSHCSVTADLRQESLYKKLDLICEITQAQYKVTDGQILITGAGCNNQ